MHVSPWQHEPQNGPYCIYHQRQPGDLNYNYTHEASRAKADCSTRLQAVPVFSHVHVLSMPISTAVCHVTCREPTRRTQTSLTAPGTRTSCAAMRCSWSQLASTMSWCLCTADKCLRF